MTIFTKDLIVSEAVSVERFDGARPYWAIYCQGLPAYNANRDVIDQLEGDIQFGGFCVSGKAVPVGMGIYDWNHSDRNDIQEPIRFALAPIKEKKERLCSDRF